MSNYEFWQKLSGELMEKFFIPFLKSWKEEKEKKGFIPTVELLLEELENNES